MSDVELYRIQSGKVKALPKKAAAIEKKLQTLIEHNLETLLAVRFLASEYSTGTKHRGRIDTLGIDENGCPVIIEYKRNVNENVINQGLFYLDWLMDHQAEFTLLTQKKYPELTDAIDWSSPRLVCIAEDFSRYDQYAVEQINRNIDLIRYAFFGDDLLMLEQVTAVTATTQQSSSVGTALATKTIGQVLESLSGPTKDLYEALRSAILALGDDVQEKVLKYYVAFKRIKNFACVEVFPSAQQVKVFVKLNPDEVTLETGFTRDVRKIGHFGTGDLEITLRSMADLEKAMPLIVKSYEMT